MKKGQAEPTKVKQGFKHVRNDSRPVLKKVMSKSSLVAKKSTKKAPEVKGFNKPKISTKAISFMRSEAKELKGKD